MEEGKNPKVKTKKKLKGKKEMRWRGRERTEERKNIE